MLDNGKYRSKSSEWSTSTSSNPALNDISEHEESHNDSVLDTNYKQSSNRRSSLGIFRKAEFEKSSRRRTSLANPFVLFGRKDSHKVPSISNHSNFLKLITIF